MLETTYDGGGAVDSVNGQTGAVTIDKAGIGLANVDNTSDANKPVSSAQQTAIDAKEDASNKGIAGGYAGLDGSGKVSTAQLPASVIGAVDYQGTWNAGTDTPAIPAAGSGNKGWYYRVSTAGATNVDGVTDWQVGDWIISNGAAWEKVDNTEQVTSVNGQQGDVTLAKADVGLGNVDNTSDATKNAAAVTLTNKTLTAPVINSPTGIVKGDVGLGNVDNTSDANKPVSTAQAAAIALKADKTITVNGHDLSANVTVTKADVGLGNVDNTSDANKPVSTAQATAIALKADLASPALTGNPTAPNQSAGNNSTRIANTAYVEAAVAALSALVSGALVFKGSWDASAGTFPGGGTAQTGAFYKVSVAGTVNGHDFSVGDDIYAITNNASTATYAANWLKIEGQVTLGEVQTAVGFTFGSLAALSTITASLISDATANGRSLITAANYAAMKTLLAIAVGDVTGAEATANKGAANGYASLGSDSKVPSAQLPAFPAASNPIPSGGTTGQVLTKIDGTDYNTQWTTAATRNVLTADTTFYIRTDGSDANNGLANTAGGAYLTWQGAYNALLKYDLAGYTATVQVGDGTYTGALSCSTPIFGGNVVWQGNAGTPANVLLSTTSNDAIMVSGQGHHLTFKNFKIVTTTSGHGIHAIKDGICSYQGINFGACAGSHITAEQNSQVICTGNYSISGNATAHWATYSLAQVNVRGFTITLTGTPAFSTDFAYTEAGGIQSVDLNTFSGGATGARYQIKTGGTINTGGGGANYLPGNSAGTNTSGYYV